MIGYTGLVAVLNVPVIYLTIFLSNPIIELPPEPKSNLRVYTPLSTKKDWMSAILFETLLIRFNNLRSRLAGLGIKLFSISLSLTSVKDILSTSALSICVDIVVPFWV